MFFFIIHNEQCSFLYSQEHRVDQLHTQYNREGYHPHKQIEPSTDIQPMRDRLTHHCSPTLRYSSRTQQQTTGARRTTHHPLPARMLHSHLTVILNQGYPPPLPRLIMRSSLVTKIIAFLIQCIHPVVTMITIVVSREVLLVVKVTKEALAFIQVLQLDTKEDRANCFQYGYIDFVSICDVSNSEKLCNNTNYFFL